MTERFENRTDAPARAGAMAAASPFGPEPDDDRVVHRAPGPSRIGGN